MTGAEHIMVSSDVIDALYWYISGLESPLQEVNAQIEKAAQLILEKGETGVVTSFTVNSKTFTFEGRVSAHDTLVMWTKVKQRIEGGIDTVVTATRQTFQIAH